ncbi:unnamed protein product [Pedinophyceae sp. YPF-701]|nr:unnamed protein product [Pedinophyceae sp. YPF-701]
MTVGQGATVGGADILRPALDTKQYQFVTLDNGLRALLVHDPHVAKSLEHRGSDGAGDGEMESESGSVGSELDGSDDGSGSEDPEMDEGEDEDGSAGPAGKKPAAGGERAKTKAAAALSVGVGSFSDPQDLQGLAHYLEHMLFMGSAPFPEENGYDDFLSKHGGSSNAFTDAEQTTFYFDVNPAHLRDALDRFAQFFISPLCLAGSLEREVQAVENEFAGVKQTDGCRAVQLRCHTANAGHVLKLFGWGNRQSLWDGPRAQGIDVRERLLEFYKTMYSAERMALVVQGGQPLEQLREWVTGLFAPVPAGRGPPPRFDALGSPFAQQPPKMIVFPAVRDTHTLQLVFALPCLADRYEAKGEEYFGHLLGHEGRGSLLAALKQRGLATGIYAGTDDSGYDKNSAAHIFAVQVNLTTAGLTRYKEVVALTFQYVEMLRRKGPQRWVWEEIRDTARMRFRFEDDDAPADFCAEAACNLHMYRPEHVLSGPYQYGEYDETLLVQLLELLRPTAEGWRIEIQTSDINAVLLPSDGSRGHEPWFDLDYVVRDVAAADIEEWATATPAEDLALPPHNSYVPTDFSVLSPEQDCGPAPLHASPGPDAPLCSAPALLSDTPGLRVWHKLDGRFKQPKAYAYFCVHSPLTAAGPRELAATALVQELLRDALTEEAYMAETANLLYHVSTDPVLGLQVKVEGFTHRMPRLVEQIFAALRGLAGLVGAGDFERVREDVARKYKNAHLKPGKHALWTRLYAIKPLDIVTADTLEQIEALTLAEVMQHLARLLSSCHVEALVIGNVTREGAAQMARTAREMLSEQGGVLTADARRADKVVRLPEGCAKVVSVPAKNPAETNSAVELYLQGPLDRFVAPRDRVIVHMLESLLDEPLFNTLRTKEQLGYAVHGGYRLTLGVLGYGVQVVSSQHGPELLEASVEAFLASARDTLAGKSAEDFEKQRSAVAQRLSMRDPNLYEEAERHWYHILHRRYQFYSRDAELSQLQEVTLSECLEWYDAYIKPGSPHRRKISVHVCAAAHATGREPWHAAAQRDGPSASLTQVYADVAAWRAGLEAMPMLEGDAVAPWAS